jgi:hypothetical protein
LRYEVWGSRVRVKEMEISSIRFKEFEGWMWNSTSRERQRASDASSAGSMSATRRSAAASERLGFQVWGYAFKDYSLGYAPRDYSLWFRVYGSGFGV